MPDASTANLALPLLQAAQAQKHVTHNEALVALDTLVQLAVLDKDLTAPPASPAEGDRYLIAGACPTGAWAGWAGRVVRYQDGVWLSFVPRTGWLAFVTDDLDLYTYTGGGWALLRSTVATFDNLARLGIGTTADAQNPFAAKLNKALWTALTTGEGGTGDLRYTLNKEAAGNTLSLLFQTGFSGRAEFGLTGDDDVRLKVSADGSAWRDALRVDRSTGGLDLAAVEASASIAATVDLGGLGALRVTLTGTGTVTSFGTVPNRVRFLRFTAAATLTHNATSLVLPGGANIVTVAGDTALAASDASGNWRVLNYARASGKALTGPAAGDISNATTTGRTVLTGTAATGATALGLGAGDSPTHASLTLNRNGTATASLPAAPSGSAMRLVGADSALSVISAEAYGGQAFFTLRRASGTAASPSSTGAGDAMGLFGTGGYVTGTGFVDYTGRLNFMAAEAFTATAQGTVVTLSACKRGTTAQFTMATFDPDLGTSFGGVVAAPLLRVTGSYTVATLPAAGQAGRMVHCSNARMLGIGGIESAGAGSGGLVYDTGAKWKLAGTNIDAQA